MTQKEKRTVSDEGGIAASFAQTQAGVEEENCVRHWFLSELMLEERSQRWTAQEGIRQCFDSFD